jgi:hypothetical protein
MYIKRISEASANLYATDNSGGTLPSWNVMTNQVDPQIMTVMM